MEDKPLSRAQRLYIALGPLLFALVMALLPASLFELGARVAVGAVVWMGFWWITVPVSPAVTAFVPIVVNALFGVLPMGGVISNYFSEIVVLLLGAELLAIAWQATGFDRRLSLKVLCVIGPSATQQIVIWFVAAGGAFHGAAQAKRRAAGNLGKGGAQHWLEPAFPDCRRYGCGWDD